MKVNSTIHKAILDTALANGSIGENDVTFVKDPDNFEGVVLGGQNNKLEFFTLPTFTQEDSGKVLVINNEGVPEWKNITIGGGGTTNSQEVELLREDTGNEFIKLYGVIKQLHNLSDDEFYELLGIELMEKNSGDKEE